MSTVDFKVPFAPKTRLGLLCTTLRLLGEGNKLKQLSLLEGKSIKTIKNRISLALKLGLVSKYQGEFFLTELGENLYI
jgi:hypothetical protein